MRSLAVLFTLSLALAACHRAAETAVAGAPPVDPPPAVTTIDGLAGPESALYDPQQDVYFISNINGGELAVDGNGFISRVDAKTLQVNLKWIEGGRDGVKLDGPKGMTIVGDALWVSDVTAVRAFDRRSGAPLQEVALPGATFINDLTNDGANVYVSDTGLKMGPGTTFAPTGTDAIWRIAGGRAEKIAAGPGLGHPNGLAWVDGKLWVATFGGREVYQLDGGKKANARTLPAGQLDGLVDLGGGTFLVSSWLGNAVYRVDGRGTVTTTLQAIDAPADIGYDARHHRLLVPRSGANQVTIHPLP